MVREQFQGDLKALQQKVIELRISKCGFIDCYGRSAYKGCRESVRGH